MSFGVVQEMAVDAVESVGGCAILSPDGLSICILAKGHFGACGWSARRVFDSNDVLDDRDVLDDHMEDAYKRGWNDALKAAISKVSGTSD